MKRYNPTEIEPKWQEIWHNDNRYHAGDDSSKSKYYVTGMFPYPSGAGMHTGHFFEHAIVDSIARFRRAQGQNVMYPMGWDSFGLPAENYAIKTGTSPAASTAQNIANFTNQLKRVGASIDWQREINTSDPEYYKWTQWVFTKFYERGLAYQKEANQWWCPVDKTVLANEQVEGGKCWRCGTEVVKKSMKQWFFKITDYADALLEEIPALDWPEKIKTAQKNWIGRSEGAEIEFAVTEQDSRSSTLDTRGKAEMNVSSFSESSIQNLASISIFTTQPDTIFGATFMVVAPEHPIVKQIVTDDAKLAVEKYVADALKKSDIERMSEGKEKTGVFTGAHATNPATGEKIPIWVADYVLWGYGTGAIMAVPAHDERDFAFAEKYDLPIVSVIDAKKDKDGIVTSEGILINSDQFDGTPTSDAREQIVAWLEQQGVGKSKTTYKMRDWLISRQRYWGAPIPIIHCEKDGAVAVPEKDLPVLLPEVQEYEPKGQSVLASQTDWVNTTCPKCGSPAKRETDTMDGYACSSWYLLRYADPHNAEHAWSKEKANYWEPVDMYVGGDHAVAHLLYVRFWNHVFYEMGLVPTKEPVKKLVYHGYINAEDGTKMSKSKGNVVDPLEVIDTGYGADALRTYELFLGPINEDSTWSSKGIAGVYRFLNRLWTLTQEYLQAEKSASQENTALTIVQHRTVKKVTSDIHRLNFNTAIAAMMEGVNELYKLKTDGFSEQWQQVLEQFVQLVQPFAPHMAAELWEQLGHSEQIDFVAWPTWDEAKVATETMTIIVQVNGKVRAKIETAKDTSEEAIKTQALAEENVKKFVATAKVQRIVYVPGRLVNIVIS
jgi:leucyl-tRNA synthetase